jgi:glutaconate CoA-transferase subunit B
VTAVPVERADPMVCAMARILAAAPVGTLLGGATPLSTLASHLAVAVYRPDLAVLGSQGRWGAAPQVGLLGQEDLAANAPGTVPLDLEAIFRAVAGGRFRIWILPAQVDRQGNANLSRVGPAAAPRPALVGSRGLPDDSVLLPQSLYYLTRHTARTVRDRVDHVTAVGDPALRPVGARPGGRPAFLVTPLGVWDFSGQGGAMRLRAILPGVGEAEFDEAQEPYPAPPPPPVVSPPTPAERQALEGLDPFGVRRLELADGAAADALRRRIRREEEALLVPDASRRSEGA